MLFVEDVFDGWGWVEFVSQVLAGWLVVASLGFVSQVVGVGVENDFMRGGWLFVCQVGLTWSG